MAVNIQLLNLGTTPNDNTGDPARTGGQKINNNFNNVKNTVEALEVEVDGKAPILHTHTPSQVGLGNVDNTSDLNKPISTATQTALNGKEPTIPTGTAQQYIKGDKTLGTFPTVDQTIIDGSTNAVSGNAVFDGLALKANDNEVVKLGLNQTITSVKTISPTLTATANNQQLLALDVAPVFNSGGFTGVQNIGARINGDINLNGFITGTVSRVLPSGTTAIGQTFNITGTSTSSNFSTGQTINLNEDGIAWANSTAAFGLYCLSNKSTNQPSKDITGFIVDTRQNGTGTLRTIECVTSRVSGTGTGNVTQVSLFAGRTTVLPFLVSNFRGLDLRTLPDLTGGGVTNSRAIEIGDVYGSSSARGIDMNVSFGVGKFNIYAQGTASNYFAGNVLINTTTDNAVPTDKLQVAGNVLATGFKTPTGTASQFLKANGTVDSNTYAPTASPTFTGSVVVPTAVNANEAVNKGQLDAVASSGNYIPTFTATANVTGTITNNGCSYIRVGNVISVNCNFTIRCTAANTLTTFTITLPVPRVSSGTAGLITGFGVVDSNGTTVFSPMIIKQQANTTTVEVSYYAADTLTRGGSVTFNYLAN